MTTSPDFAHAMPTLAVGEWPHHSPICTLLVVASWSPFGQAGSLFFGLHGSTKKPCCAMARAACLKRESAMSSTGLPPQCSAPGMVVEARTRSISD